MKQLNGLIIRLCSVFYNTSAAHRIFKFPIEGRLVLASNPSLKPASSLFERSGSEHMLPADISQNT